jgi:hypothetical protein
MAGALARHDAIVREAVGAYGGTVFSTMGDGMEVTGPLAARMGIWTDEGVPGGADYQNQPLNRCAWLMAAGLTEAEVRDALAVEAARAVCLEDECQGNHGWA